MVARFVSKGSVMRAQMSTLLNIKIFNDTKYLQTTLRKHSKNWEGLVINIEIVSHMEKSW